MERKRPAELLWKKNIALLLYLAAHQSGAAPASS